MRFTVSEFYAVCGVLSMEGALAAPFLLYHLVKKAVERRRALGECAALCSGWLPVFACGLPSFWRLPDPFF